MPQADLRSTIILLPKTLPQDARVKVEAAIEAHSEARDALIAFLDQIDGDPDAEPSLGQNPYGMPVALLDCEGDEHDGHEPDEDFEPDVDEETPAHPERCGGSYGANGARLEEASHP